VVLWVETTEEGKGLNTTNPKTSTDVQPIRKPPTPTVNNKGKYRNLKTLKEEKSQPNSEATQT